MRVGVFGGSFDPVHLGHLQLAEFCRAHARLDRVEFVPAARQPLKAEGPIASDDDRAAMLFLAMSGQPDFRLSTMEIDRGGVSYTADTLRQFSRQRPGAELFFLMGADSLAEFAKWRQPEVICQLATPLVVRRPGAAAPDFAALRPLVSPDRFDQIVLAQIEMPPTPISSTQIRALIASGGPWRAMVPPAVADYIDEHRLYR
ncbi:MAG: nicotinate (nicotinamide) nucleotide adenylyltransferase [Pirellulales bacterium]|nr:nicotinate (nicotinamide) nucleotide adenylyltransferase [Pirellulales bacterium]